MNSNPLYAHQAKIFHHLLENDMGSELLKKNLIELYANYSRQLVKMYSEQGQVPEPMPLGNVDQQLYTVLQLIAVLDSGNKEELFAELNTIDNPFFSPEARERQQLAKNQGI